MRLGNVFNRMYVSVCVCLSVCLYVCVSFCNALTFESLDIESSSFWHASTSSEYLGQGHISRSSGIGVARIFSGGVHFFLTKNRMTFFSHHQILHANACPNSTTNYLFSSSVGCTSTNSAHFSSFQQKMPRKKFLWPWGCTCTPGYAYGQVTEILEPVTPCNIR